MAAMSRKIAGVFGKGNTKRTLDRKPTASGNALTRFKGASAKHVKTDDLSPDDIIIAVMGPTGSGKSSFINAITGLGIGVGHELESCTSKVSNVRLSIPEVAFGDLVFVDTPGFDDTHRNDVDILKMVADWLKLTYEKNIKLSGLLYFHRISDNRMAGTPLKNLRMFEELCGKNAFQNVILTTTMWDEVDEETGEARERELKEEYWRTMLERSSTTSRFLRTRESAFNLIDPLIETGNRKSSVLLQEELVDMRKRLPATAAGQELFSTMGKLVSQREDLLRRIRNEMRRSDGDEMTLEPLQEEHQRLQNSLEETLIEMRKLRLPLGRRFVIMTDRFFSSKFEFVKSFISKRKTKPAPNTESPTSSIDSYVPVSKDLIDYTHQSESPPGSAPHTPLLVPRESTTTEDLGDDSKFLKESLMPMGDPDRPSHQIDPSPAPDPPTSNTATDSKPEEQSQTNHSSSGSGTTGETQDTSHTPPPIDNGSNVLPPGQEPASDTLTGTEPEENRSHSSSSTTKETQETDSIVSSDRAPSYLTAPEPSPVELPPTASREYLQS